MSIKLGDYYIAGGGGSGNVDTDNVTISKNTSDKIQAIGTKNKNSTGDTENLYDWVGTLSEYNTQQIETLHPEWICYITDDISGGESVYTKEEVDEGFLATNKITNCITQIPQDIKLELNNGTLTLKAGSKVYIPNGFESDGTTPKFDVVTVESDITYTKTSVNTGKSILFLYQNLTLGAFTAGGDSSTRFYFSGNTTPSNIETYGLWYDTANNLIKYTSDSGSTWTSGCPLPLAIFSYDTSVTSIDQVFNGFGYIGSTVFALPGVKGLIPNGRNADGSLKNTELSLSTVIKAQISGTYNSLKFAIALSGIGVYYFDYDDINNYVYRTDTGARYYDRVICGNISVSSSKVTSLNVKTAFHALDYNDSSTISGWSMPSDRYINLTLLASGSQYTAPANGWFNCQVRLASSGQGVVLQNTTTGTITRVHAASSNQLVSTFILARKGDIIIYQYGTEATTSPSNSLRFYYAEGEV